MSFLVHSDEHGWLRTWTNDFGRTPQPMPIEVAYGWTRTRAAAYRFGERKVAEALKLPNVAILEERDQ